MTLRYVFVPNLEIAIYDLQPQLRNQLIDKQFAAFPHTLFMLLFSANFVMLNTENEQGKTVFNCSHLMFCNFPFLYTIYLFTGSSL